MYLRNQLLVFALAFLGLFSAADLSAQCGSLVDLRSWTQQGPASSGDWVVNAGGTSVVQNINGLPTFFVSPQSFINVRMTGTFTTSGGDDDMMGFVFGYLTPIASPGPNYNVNTWLFDWKQRTQNIGGITAPEGRFLSRVNGPIALGTQAAINPTFWAHQNDPNFTVIQSTQGVGTGWVRNTVYNFELTYMSDRVVIVVNNDTFFDYTDCFQPGRFGFYNNSQNPVTYSNFSYEILPDFRIASNTVCVSDSAEFFFIDNACPSVVITPNVIASYAWDFGDGGTSSLANPKHLYSTPGTYTVTLTVTDNIGCTDMATQTITILPLPVATVTNNGPLCAGQTLNLTATAPTGVTYSWSGPNSFASTNQNPSIANVTTANSGTYTLDTDNGFCAAQFVFPVTVNPTPATPSASSNGPLCEDSLLTLTSSPVAGASYSWTGPVGFNSTQQNPTIANPQTNRSGTYSVTATVNGCPSASGTVNVLVNPTPVVAINGVGTICQGDPTSLSASGANSYVWSTGSTANTINVSPAATTTYSVVGTSAVGCPSVPQTFMVTVNNAPALALGPDLVVCDTVTLDAGASATTYAWSNGPTTQSQLINQSGIYAVTVSSGANCVAADTIIVTINTTPTVAVAGDQVICEGDASVLTASGANSYVWSDGAMTAVNTVSPTTTTTYSVVGSGVGGCAAPSQSITVQVDPLPTVALGPDQTVCDVVTLDAGGTPTSYLWSTGATSQTISVTQSGSYIVTVMNADSCTASDTIDVIVNPTVLANLGVDQTICPTTSATLSSTGNFLSYTWSNGSSQPQIVVSQAGDYYVDVVDANGCPSSDTVSLALFPQLFGSLGPDTLICDGDIAVLDASSWGGATYLWLPSGITSSTLSVDSADTYSVLIDDGNGCVYNDSIVVNEDTPPAMSISVSDSALCSGEPLIFTSGPATLAGYTFLDGGAVAQTGPSGTWTTSSLQPGNNVEVVGTTVNGCLSDTASLAVSVNILARPTGIALVDTVCAGAVTNFNLATVDPTLTVTWTGTGGFSGTGNNLTHTYLGAGVYSYAVVVDNGLCDTTIYGTANVLSNPGALTTTDVTVCDGGNATLMASGTGSLEWYDSPTGGNLLQAGDTFAITAASASATFYIEQNLAGCTSSRTAVQLTVSPIPTAAFMSNPDTSIRLNIPQSEVQFVNLSNGAFSYLWEFGDGASSTFFSPTHQFSDIGNYTVSLIATNTDGCSDTASLGTFEVFDYEGFNVPNGFSPNGDGDNDTWVIDDIYFYPNNKVWVYNRWGKTVFETEGYQNDWNGEWNGKPLPEGNYFWVIDLGEGSRPEKGHLVIFR